MDMIEKVNILLKFIILGLVQGFTEPIPISSSGHLVLIRELFQIEFENLSFEIIVHFGSLIAIVYTYRKEVSKLTANFLKFCFERKRTYKTDFLFVTYLFIATFFTGVIGLFLEDFINEELTKPIFIGLSLVITGFFLWIIRHNKGTRLDKDITIKDAVIIGLTQAIALIPGISRSGTTVVTAILLGLERKTALKFSFLLFIPVSFGITIVSIKDIVNDLITIQYIIPYIIAFFISVIATYIALKWFINIMQKGKLHIFAIYCFVVGTTVILFM